MKTKILVSSCLLGEHVRYDGVIKDKDKILFALYEKGMVISVCPEVAGGLCVPRAASEISSDGKKVVNKNGTDVTLYFVQGAKTALNLCIEYKIKVAILKSNSPSCSNGYIYDGTFSDTLIKGKGITTMLLEKNGILVFNENEIEKALYAAGYPFKDLLHE